MNSATQTLALHVWKLEFIKISFFSFMDPGHYCLAALCYESPKIYQIYRENTDFYFTLGFHPIVLYPSAILLGHPSIYIYVSEGLF